MAVLNLQASHGEACCYVMIVLCGERLSAEQCVYLLCILYISSR